MTPIRLALIDASWDVSRLARVFCSIFTRARVRTLQRRCALTPVQEDLFGQLLGRVHFRRNERWRYGKLNQCSSPRLSFLSNRAEAGAPALVTAVSNAGALGSLSCVAMPIKTARDQIVEIRRASNRPFNLNFFVHPAPRVDARDAKQRFRVMVW
jgi:hypothetical protein